MPINLSIIGAGGHAKVVVDSLEYSAEDFQIDVFEEGSEAQGMLLGGYSVNPLRDWGDINEYFHVAIGLNNARSRISKNAIKHNKKLFTILHNLAIVSESASLQGGVFVAANSIIAPEVVIETGCIINHAAVIDHDCVIGEYSHIAPSATLGGGVNVGQQCLIGAGAVVLPGVSIGNFAVIGAGSIVTKDIPKNGKFAGNPARKI
jgi:sugar O-acyltransferase (sialic acid O-acetyltransferase NeuD family)